MSTVDCSTLTPPTSSQTTRVYDLDTLKAEAQYLGIPPTRPNIRRIRRALDIVDNDKVRLLDTIVDVRIYEVRSQTRPLVHLVVANDDNRCTCEDARKHRNFTGCKHDIAVRLFEDRQFDEAIIDEDARYGYLFEPTSPYRIAKQKIDNLPVTAIYDRPDSLTRRGDQLIARFRYGVHWTPEAARQDWLDTVKRVFPDAKIGKVTIDRKRNARAYFSFPPEVNDA